MEEILSLGCWSERCDAERAISSRKKENGRSYAAEAIWSRQRATVADEARGYQVTSYSCVVVENERDCLKAGEGSGSMKAGGRLWEAATASESKSLTFLRSRSRSRSGRGCAPLAVMLNGSLTCRELLLYGVKGSENASRSQIDRSMTGLDDSVAVRVSVCRIAHGL